jgi:hypothetical protein
MATRSRMSQKDQIHEGDRAWRLHLALIGTGRRAQEGDGGGRAAPEQVAPGLSGPGVPTHRHFFAGRLRRPTGLQGRKTTLMAWDVFRSMAVPMASR